MRDEDEREVPLPAELGQEVQDLGLDRDVEGRDRLVENEQLGLEDQCSSDADSLTLTTRVVEALRTADAGDIAVIVGGTIPQADVPKLLAAGAVAVFPTGTPLEDLVRGVRALTSAAPERVEE